MTAERWRTISQLYHEALTRSADDRAAFLAERCAGDHELRKEIESLLGDTRDAQRFFDVPANAQLLARLIDRTVPAPSTSPRFIPGSMFAGRYRIVNLIGRGGMGEVYRADDLKLGQPVALKFLPEALVADPDRLARFLREVRIARQVTHPHVCRVYDIGEADGQHFISMEYVDGEDLASLLRRIGRIPAAKALEMAHQLCSGLVAAHERKVLHCDLKPSNVLIDAHGRVRIADFGVAALAGDPSEPQIGAGTPAYMSPERLAGQDASIRSDLYALGLVLYEIFTGASAFASDETGVHTRRSRATPIDPSRVVPDLDQAIERVILQCLESDPNRRPTSALAVAAALPGGRDLFLAAKNAQETPSPEMVAAAGPDGSISPSVAIVLLTAVALGLTSAIWMSQKTTLASFVTIEKGPEAFAERARVIANALGYAMRPADSAYGYERDDNYLAYIRARDSSPSRWEALRRGRTPPLRFWYRQSPRHLGTPTDFFAFGQVTRTDPPAVVPGMVSVTMDPAGRLMDFTAVPEQANVATVPSQPLSEPGRPDVDWRSVFALADLPIDQFVPVPPTVIPAVYADSRVAWEGRYPDVPDIAIRVEAASAQGRPVYFSTITPWTSRAPDLPPSPPTSTNAVTSAAEVAFVLAAFIGSVLLARHNVRTGRSDRRGAMRLTCFAVGTTLLAGILPIHDVVDLLPRRLILTTVGSSLVPFALWYGAVIWVTYLAVEPFVRRVWRRR